MSTNMPEDVHFIGFMQEVSKWEGCRCAELRRVFGTEAPPLCGPCGFRARRLELIANTWVDTPTGYRQAYLDCGVEPTTLEDGSVWVPCWASTIVTRLYGSVACGPILTRAAFDEDFREATVAFIALNAALPGEVLGTSYQRLVAFAVGAGVPITTSTA